RGRGGLLVAAFGVIVALGGLFAANGDRGLVRTLSERGIGASAVVTGVSHGRTGSLMNDVRFTVHDRELTEALRRFNNVPDTLKKGQRVRIVYDPADPSQVLLNSQLHSDLIPMDYGVALAGGILALLGSGWWAIRRRRKRN